MALQQFKNLTWEWDTVFSMDFYTKYINYLQEQREDRAVTNIKFIIAFALSFFFISIFNIVNSHNANAEEVFLSNEDFLKGAFAEDIPRRKGLRFKGEVKEIAQRIMGSNYKKLRMKYWRQDQKTAWILQRIGKFKLITAGFIVENCRISSTHVLVYRETHGWEVKYPSFRDQFVGISMAEGFKLDKSIDGIAGATLSVNSMEKMARLALAMNALVPEINCN